MAIIQRFIKRLPKKHISSVRPGELVIVRNEICREDPRNRVFLITKIFEDAQAREGHVWDVSGFVLEESQTVFQQLGTNDVRAPELVWFTPILSTTGKNANIKHYAGTRVLTSTWSVCYPTTSFLVYSFKPELILIGNIANEALAILIEKQETFIAIQRLGGVNNLQIANNARLEMEPVHRSFGPV